MHRWAGSSEVGKEGSHQIHSLPDGQGKSEGLASRDREGGQRGMQVVRGI